VTFFPTLRVLHLGSSEAVVLALTLFLRRFEVPSAVVPGVLSLLKALRSIAASANPMQPRQVAFDHGELFCAGLSLLHTRSVLVLCRCVYMQL
jgi:hypothetical protein